MSERRAGHPSYHRTGASGARSRRGRSSGTFLRAKCSEHAAQSNPGPKQAGRSSISVDAAVRSLGLVVLHCLFERVSQRDELLVQAGDRARHRLRAQNTHTASVSVPPGNAGQPGARLRRVSVFPGGAGRLDLELDRRLERMGDTVAAEKHVRVLEELPAAQRHAQLAAARARRGEAGAHIRSRFPSVWSSLSMMSVAAFMIRVSFWTVTLRAREEGRGGATRDRRRAIAAIAGPAAPRTFARCRRPAGDDSQSPPAYYCSRQTWPRVRVTPAPTQGQRTVPLIKKN